MSSRSGSRSTGSDSDRLSWSPSPSFGERSPSPPLCSSDPIFLRPTNDILLRSNDRQSFPFERALLEVQSPVFRDLVRGARPEPQSAQGELKHGGLRIADVDESATNLEHLLRFLHPGAQRPQISSVGEVISLCETADRFKLQAISSTIVSSCLGLLDLDTAPNVLGLAILYRQPAFVVLALRLLDSPAGKRVCAISEMSSSLLKRLPYPVLYELWLHRSLNSSYKAFIKTVQSGPAFFNDSNGLRAVAELGEKAQEARRKRWGPHPDPSAAAAAAAPSAPSAAAEGAASSMGVTATDGPASGDAALLAAPGAAVGGATAASILTAPKAPARKSPQPDWDLKRWLLHFRDDLVPGPIVHGSSLGRNTAALLAIRSGDLEKAFLVRPDLLRGHIGRGAFESIFAGGQLGPQKRLKGGGAEIVDLPGVEGTILTLFLQYVTPSVAIKPAVTDFETLEKLCELAEQYDAHHVAVAALGRSAAYHLSTRAPEILGYAMRYLLPSLLAAALRAFDRPPHICDCGPCARQKALRHQLQDVPYHLLARVPLAVFMRLVRREAEQVAAPYYTPKRWADVAKQVEENPGWFEDSEAFLTA